LGADNKDSRSAGGRRLRRAVTELCVFLGRR
jgi:hypothetical protein